jgi:hypothetical protein
MSPTGRTIDLPLFAGCALMIVALSQLLGAILPLNVYFSFRAFLLNEEGTYRYVALAIKLLIPFVSGLLSSVAFGYLLSGSYENRLRFYALIANAYAPSLFAAGFFSGLLQAWPQIAYWDVFADPRVLDYKIYFFIAYGLYFIAFGYFALAGGLLSLNLLQHGGVDLYFPGRDTLLKFGTIARSGVLGFVATGLGTSMVEVLSSIKGNVGQ